MLRRAEVVALLRFGHGKRRPRTRGHDRRGQIPDRVSIRDRPAEIAERLVPGPWEGDTIKGRYNRSAVGALVERKTLFVTLARMNGTGAEAAVEGFSTVPARIAAQHQLSMTYNQGKEMSRSSAARCHVRPCEIYSAFFPCQATQGSALVSQGK